MFALFGEGGVTGEGATWLLVAVGEGSGVVVGPAVAVGDGAGVPVRVMAGRGWAVAGLAEFNAPMPTAQVVTPSTPVTVQATADRDACMAAPFLAVASLGGFDERPASDG